MTPFDGEDVASPATDARHPPARSVRITTSHEDPGVVAGAIGPDNTDHIETTVLDGAVVTTVDRSGTGGLQSTVDDYLRNLQVADAVAAETRTRRAAGGEVTQGHPGDGGRSDRQPDDSERTHSQPTDEPDTSHTDQ